MTISEFKSKYYSSKEYKRELKESGIKDSDTDQIAELKRKRNRRLEMEEQDAIVHGAETNDYGPYTKVRAQIGSRKGATIGGLTGITYGVVKSLGNTKGNLLGTEQLVLQRVA